MNQDREQREPSFSLLGDDELPELFQAIVLQSPISTWIADKDGTLAFENAANRLQFGIERDEEVVGKYNIFKDEELLRQGLIPRIRRVFEEGGSTEFIVDYDFSKTGHVTPSHPTHKVLRAFLFAINDRDGHVRYVVVQHEDFTERKQSEDAMRASEANYRAIFDAANDAIFVHDVETGAILDVNRKMREMYGYSPEEARELPMEALSAGEPPYAQEDAIRWTRKAVAGDPQLFEWKAKDKSGRLFWVEVNLKRAVIGGHDRILAVVRDITERKHAEEAIRRSEENFRAIFDYMPAAMFSYDRNGVIVQANRACERLYGFKRRELIGRSMFETIAKEEVRELSERVIAEVFSGKAVEDIEWEDVRADGSAVYVLTNTTPVLDSNGDVVMGLSLNVDITERKLAEQRQRELDRHEHDFYRRTILAATEGRLIISERDEIKRIAGRPIKTWDIVSGEELGVIRHEVMEMAQSFGMDESRAYDFVLAVGEMSTNALKHAGSGQASLHKSDDELIFVVSDQGPGIEAVTLPEVALVRGYSTAGTLGMGYKALLSVADRVYLATGPGGTTVAVAMSLHPVPQKPTAIPDTWARQK